MLEIDFKITPVNKSWTPISPDPRTRLTFIIGFGLVPRKYELKSKKLTTKDVVINIEDNSPKVFIGFFVIINKIIWNIALKGYNSLTKL